VNESGYTRVASESKKAIFVAILGIFLGRQLNLPYLDGVASVVIGVLHRRRLSSRGPMNTNHLEAFSDGVIAILSTVKDENRKSASDNLTPSALFIARFLWYVVYLVIRLEFDRHEEHRRDHVASQPN
jgi:hypothetical protein